MRSSRENWRGEAEISSLAPKKGNKADTSQGFSHHAQVLLATPLSSGGQGREIPTHRTPPRRPLAASKRERARTWRQRWEVQTREELAQEWGGSCPGEKPAAFRHAGQEKPLTGVCVWRRVSTTTAPTTQKKKRKNNLVSASETPMGVSRGRSSLVSELRLQRTLNCTSSLVRPLDSSRGDVYKGSSYLCRGPRSLGGIWRSAPGLGLGRAMARPPQFPLAIARRSRVSIGYLSA